MSAGACSIVGVRGGSWWLGGARRGSAGAVARERPDGSLRRAVSQSGSVRRMIFAWCGVRVRVCPSCDHVSGIAAVRYDFAAESVLTSVSEPSGIYNPCVSSGIMFKCVAELPRSETTLAEQSRDA